MANESDKKKLLIAAVLLVLAVVVIAWNMNWFSSDGATPSTDAAAAPVTAAEAAKAGVKPRANARMVEQPK
ncbi:MAG: hypothetical protein AABZ53_11555 [Planctomycetota bacterium]